MLVAYASATPMTVIPQASASALNVPGPPFLGRYLGLPYGVKVRSRKKEDVSHVLAPSKGLSKLIPIDEKPNHQIVHAFRFRETDRPTH